jgi:hypothetical protein
MILVKRQEVYSVKINGKTFENIEEHTKTFLDHKFYPILSFLEKKGLIIKIPSKIDGWDATFAFEKLNDEKHNLGPTAEEFALFLYMRLERTRPIWIEQKGIFSF